MSYTATQQIGTSTNPFDISNISEEIYFIRFLFSKKINQHLLDVLNYLNSKTTNEWAENELLEINSIISDEKRVAKNLNLIYSNYKNFLIITKSFSSQINNDLSKLKSIFSSVKIEENKEINLLILEGLCDDVIYDSVLDDTEISKINSFCETLEINKTEFISVFSNKIKPFINELKNGIYINEEMKFDLINKYYSILNAYKFKYDINEASSFLNSFNIYRIKNQKVPKGLLLNIGLISLIDLPIFSVFYITHGKLKKSNGVNTVDLKKGTLYNFGDALVVLGKIGDTDILNGEMSNILYSDVKEHGESVFSNSGDKYLWFKRKGERNAYLISNFPNEEMYSFIKFYNEIKISNSIQPIILKEIKPKIDEETNNSTDQNNLLKMNYQEELNGLIGLEKVKEQITSLVNLIKAQNLRKKNNLKVVSVSLHSVFSGSPGTGKTTVARLYAGILKELGVLKKGHLVEVDRSELVAGYLGQTAIKTEEIINKSLDGVLFIDEAYSLAGADTDSFGDEAINVLLKRMEDDRERLVVIVAGYTEEMHKFIDSNPGLQSRFNRYVEFENYSENELVLIFENLAIKNEYKLVNDTKPILNEHFKKAKIDKPKDFGNGRYVRNLFEKIIQEHANKISKLSNPSENDLVNLTPDLFTIIK